MVAPAPPGTQGRLIWGRFRIVELVGRGSFGRVLKVSDVATGELRALKIVPRGGAEAMLLEEFEQLTKLRHPSLPRVFEVGRTHEAIHVTDHVVSWSPGAGDSGPSGPALDHGGPTGPALDQGGLSRPALEHGGLDTLPAESPFFLAEWIAGGRCDARAWSGPDLGARAWALVGDIAGALATIHAAGLVHGDVAPQNILIADDGRGVLVDLGLAAASGARGTPAYMAPEALAGDVEPRSDLYGLGATLVRLVTGRPLFEAAGLGELAQRIVAGGRPPPLPGLPGPLADLIGRMIARDADARPRSALAVLDELDQLAPAIAPGSPRRARPRVGAAPAPVAWPGASAVVHAIARSLASSAAVILVVGSAASGARELVDGAVRRHQLAQVARGGPPSGQGAAAGAGERAVTARPSARIVGSLDEIGAALAVAASEPGASARGWIERVARAARRCSAPVVIELAGDPRAGDLLGALARADGKNPVIAIVDRDPGSSGRPGVVVHVAPILDGEGVVALAGAMLGAQPPRAWAHALHVASSGLALAVIELVRSTATEPQPFAVDWTARTTAGMTELRARQLRAAPAAARRIAAAVAAWGGRVRIDRALATLRADGKAPVSLADVAELERLGLAHRRGDEVAIDRATADAAEAIAGSEATGRLAAAGLLSAGLADHAVGYAVRSADHGAGLAEHGAGLARHAAGNAVRSAEHGAGLAGHGAGLAGHGAGLADQAVELARHGAGPADQGVELARHGAGPADHGAGLARHAAASAERAAGNAVRSADHGAGLADHAVGSATGSTEHAAGPTERVPRLQLIAPLLERAVLDADRAGLACDAADHLLARGRPDRALALARRALAIDPARAGLVCARAAAAAGSYRDAAAYARDAEVAGADPVLARLVSARAAQRAGELDTAEDALAALHAAHPSHAEIAGTYARLLVTRSRYREARAIATAGGPLAGLRAESAGLAAFYLGELEAADTAFAALEVGAAATGDAATAGRASSLRGMVAQQRGQLGLASDRYREAWRRLGEVGELHAAATAELNLGTVLAERGRASEALPRLAAAGRVFAELGATTESCAAELNRGNALLLVGQLDEARLAAEAAIARADGAPHLRAFALIVGGDVRKRLDDDAGAIRSYREALAIAAQRGDAHAQISAHIALAEAGQRAQVGVDIEVLCASDDDRDRWTLARGRLALRDPSSVAGPRAAGAPADTAGSLADTAGSLADATAALARACAEVAARATDADRIERAFRGHAVAAQLAHRARDLGLARVEAERARVAHAAVIAATAPAFRAAIDGDPDLARLPAADPSAPDRARHPVIPTSLGARPNSDGAQAWPTGAGSRDEPQTAQLRRLLTLSRRLNTEASLERILDEVIDTAIELTCAERGFLLLRQPDGELAAVVSRNFFAGDLDAAASDNAEPVDGGKPTTASGSASGGASGSAPASALGSAPANALGSASGSAPTSGSGSRPGSRSISRSIAERAAQTGEPVVTVDAGIDERFGAAASVAALRLRSVLAVPLRQRGAVTGCIYVDHRLRGGAFDAAAASLLGELGDIAAIAIENARLTGDLRRTTREIAELNGRLSAELAERDAELARVKADLPDRDRLRHRYERIVGRSPATVKMLDLIDRAAATSLPVVVFGESGTGKELVARALHDHGPRKAGPFVAINCSAVPEPLLESELFGHARGSFTGADRDRRGLFEVADGGTLFLDEIADTSPGMQAKLLRVLQDGVIRRVGDTRTRQVDVRVIAASQQPLSELAAAGRFREDLRFRLDVIAVPVPALRERDGDIPLLVEHLLARLCAGKPAPRITRAALRALGRHRWPGNVRELENALARGVAMGGDVIDLGDLPDAIAHAEARPEPARPAVGEDLRLRPAISATERAYLAAAMARAKGNQTVAARLLGLSRFGLQKKLRRLSDDVDAGGEDD